MPGNKLAKGNPYARRQADIKAALFEASTPEEIKEVVRALFDKAKEGDIPAIKVLFAYLLGQPTARFEVTGEDGEPISITSADVAARLRRVIEALQP